MNKTIESLDGEIWRDIDGNNGAYKISTLCRVISYKGVNPKLLKPRGNEQSVALFIGNKRKSVSVNVLHKNAFSTKIQVIIKIPSYENEIWKDIVGYEGLYQISNLGRVKSLPAKIDNFRNKQQKSHYLSSTKKEKLMKGGMVGNNRSYRVVILIKNKKAQRLYVHRLVGIHFISNPENKKCINHIDGNPKNNDISNLEWVTYKENTRHSWDVLKRFNKRIFDGTMPRPTKQ